MFRLRQLDGQIKDIEQKMKKIAVGIAVTSDVIEQEKDRIEAEKKQIVVFLRKTPSMKV